MRSIDLGRRSFHPLASLLSVRDAGNLRFPTPPRCPRLETTHAHFQLKRPCYAATTIFSAPLASSNPPREPPSYPLHPIRTDLPNSPLKDLSLHDRQSADSNDTCLLEPRLLEVAVPFLNQLVEPIDLLVELRGDHADQPVVVRTRSFAYQQGWAKLALR